MITPKVSIIVPVYNVEKYIRPCLDSILAQTFTDWECILVNDGSTDMSGEICNEYVQRDTRFHYFHKENGGVSSARNMGLAEVHGEWVTFMDSDDWVESYFLSTITSYIKNDNWDCLKWGYFLEYPKKKIEKSLLQDEHVKEKKLFFTLNEKTKYDAYVWNTLYKKALLQDIRFDESINWCEDHIFTSEYYIKCNSMLLLSIPIYHHRIGHGRTLSTSVKPEMILKASQRLIALRTILAQNDRDAQKMIDDFAQHSQYRALLHLYSIKSSFIERQVFCLQLNNVFNDNTKIDRTISRIVNSDLSFIIKDILLKLCVLVRKSTSFLKRKLH